MRTLRLLMVKWLSGEYDELIKEFKESGKNEMEFFGLLKENNQ